MLWPRPVDRSMGALRHHPVSQISDLRAAICLPAVSARLGLPAGRHCGQQFCLDTSLHEPIWRRLRCLDHDVNLGVELEALPFGMVVKSCDDALCEANCLNVCVLGDFLVSHWSDIQVCDESH